MKVKNNISSRTILMVVLALALVGVAFFAGRGFSSKKAAENIMFAPANNTETETPVATEAPKAEVETEDSDDVDVEETSEEVVDAPKAPITVVLPDRQAMFAEEPHFTPENTVVTIDDIEVTPEELEEMSSEELEELLETVMDENPTVKVIDRATGEVETYVVEAQRIELSDIVAIIEEQNARRFEANDAKDEKDYTPDVGTSLVDKAEEMTNEEVKEILTTNPEVVIEATATEHIAAVVVEEEEDEPELIVQVVIEESKKDLARVWSPSGAMTEIELNDGWSFVPLGTERGEWTVNIYSWVNGHYEMVHQFTQWVGEPEKEPEEPVKVLEADPEAEEPEVIFGSTEETDNTPTPAASDDAYVVGADAEPTPAPVEERADASDGFDNWF